MSRFDIEHTTMFQYGAPVHASYNEARMHPVDDEVQHLESLEFKVVPQTWRDEYVDSWGTHVTAFEVLGEHNELSVTAHSVVATEVQPAANVAVTWEELRSEAVRDRFSAYLESTTMTEVPAEVVNLAQKAVVGLTPAQGAEAVCLAVRNEVEYVPGRTTAYTPAVEAWQSHQGVCQDMAHLATGALRSVSIPARYVSGYLHPRREAPIGQKVHGESHAWVEYWVGAWVGYDPTNRQFVSDNHIVVGRGREYGDVPPLKGVYAGAAESALTVSVDITRLA